MMNIQDPIIALNLYSWGRSEGEDERRTVFGSLCQFKNGMEKN
jgi:hypothetical protein